MDEVPQKVRIASLKSLGNIGYINDVNNLATLAFGSSNSKELRLSAIQAFEKFSCDIMEGIDSMYNLLQNKTEDVELRVQAFLAIMKCSDESDKFKSFASKSLAGFLVAEQDIQVKTLTNKLNFYNN